MTTILLATDDFEEIDFKLDDAFLSKWADMTPDEVAEDDAKLKAEALIKKLSRQRPTDAHCDTEVGKLLMIYPELIRTGEGHWSLTLIRLVQLTGFKPSSQDILLRPSSLPSDLDELAPVTLVQKHMSAICFDEIIDHVGQWAADNPDKLAHEDEERVEEDALDAVLRENQDDDHTLVYKKESGDMREGLDQSHPAWGEW